MQDLLTTKLDSELSGKSVKRLEKELASAEERLKKLLDIPHDEGVSWEETGIDYLCVDEAHLFKNLTVLSKVDDLAKPVGSQRAQDLDMKPVSYTHLDVYKRQELFDPTHAKYAAEREQLQELWSPEEWAAARRTVLNAHYTHPEYVRAMWGLSLIHI